MIEEINLKNFKCFKKVSLELSYLNIFSGINGMGKSTAIQALLLLRQSFEMGSLEKGLYLNGKLVKIGNGKDLLCRYGDDDNIVIEVKETSWDHQFTYQYAQNSDFLLLSNPDSFKETELEKKSCLFSSQFEFLSAERIGPRRTYEKSYYSTHERIQLGCQGEMAAAYLKDHRGDRVENASARYPDVNSLLLRDQVNVWISEISPGVKAEVEDFLNAGLVGLNYIIGDELGSSDFNAVNVGFGITYVFPIIVALLKAKMGELLIIENPEAHLHPRGQRKMGELIAKAASGGVQIIVETHSDHILNGLRVSVKNKWIKKEDIRLNYFYRTETEGKLVHTKVSPAILDDGSLSCWPEGFFDEWDMAIDELF